MAAPYSRYLKQVAEWSYAKYGQGFRSRRGNWYGPRGGRQRALLLTLLPFMPFPTFYDQLPHEKFCLHLKRLSHEIDFKKFDKIYRTWTN